MTKPSTKTSTKMIAISTGSLTKIKRARFNLDSCSPAGEYGDALRELLMSHPNPQQVIDVLIEEHPEEFDRYEVGLDEEPEPQPAD